LEENLKTNQEMPFGSPGLTFAFTLRREAIERYNEVKDQIESDAVNRILTLFGFTESFRDYVKGSDRNSYQGRDVQKFWFAARSLAISALSPGNSSIYRTSEKLQELQKTLSLIVHEDDDSLTQEDRDAAKNLLSIGEWDFAAAAKNIYSQLEEERKVRTQASTHVSRIRTIVDWLSSEESESSNRYANQILGSLSDYTSWAVEVVEDFFNERKNLIRYKASYVKIWISHCADVFSIEIDLFQVPELDTDLSTVSGTSWKSYKSSDPSVVEQFFGMNLGGSDHSINRRPLISELKWNKDLGKTSEKVSMEISMKEDLISAKFVIPQSRAAQIPIMQIELLNFVAARNNSLNVQLTAESDSIILSTPNKAAITEFGATLLEALRVLNNEK
jgi:hypothetical protein